MSVVGSYQNEKGSLLLANKQVFLSPAAAANNTLKAATNITATPQTLTPTTQPVVPRNITLTLVDTTPSLTSVSAVINGIDQNGKPCSETLEFTAAGMQTGSVAFAKVSSVVVTSVGSFTSGGDETMAIGAGNKHGLPVGIDGKLEEVFKALHDNVDEAVGTVDKTYATVTPTSGSGGDHNQEFWYTYKAKLPLS